MKAIRAGSRTLLVLAAACGNSGGGSAPAVDSGVEAEASATPDDWSCLGHVTLVAPAKATLMWQLQPTDLLSNTMYANLPVQACAAGDGPCATPVAMATTDATTDIATVAVPAGQAGFDGFWQTAPTGGYPGLDFSNIPIRNDLQVDVRQQWSASLIKVPLGAVAGQWDKTKGIVLVQVHNCNSPTLHQDASNPTGPAPRVLAAGVSIAIAPQAAGIVGGYVAGGTLSTTASETDASGQGDFVNVPEGWVTLTARVVATGKTVGTAHVYSRAGAVTSVVLAPSP
jgi:hypothetical protein